ncbi:hypothetical protein CK203_105031 [Vitis vinifera]|uniref:Uncharacterized protein n=1 Tax=Vitis vinifera TaxID=29760 RepID=A0A438BQG4_VITVI|nr:hypothetical protein CK203_105031 [Vitis vinifera]
MDALLYKHILEYHQILMFQPDEEKTTFMMPHGLYCYKAMSFGLKNGIEVNPDQIKTVLEMPALSSKKELQRFIGHLATLGHFIAHFMDKLRSFFFMIKGKEYEAKDERMARYLALAQDSLAKLGNGLSKEYPEHKT